jgi:CRISPR system Cascade subunit CasD
MVAFGDVMIDGLGRIREVPSQSALSSLLANALGVRREEYERLGRLQERLQFGCRIDSVSDRFTDFQTAQLGKADRSWSTTGIVHERAGGPQTYESPHIRERDYDAGVRMVVVLRLAPEEESPTLDDVAHALDWPVRPLFLGRKCCLPAGRLLDGFVLAESMLQALQLTPKSATPPGRAGRNSPLVLSIPAEGACPPGFEEVASTEERDWPAGVHAGLKRRYRGLVPQDWLAATEAS